VLLASQTGSLVGDEEFIEDATIEQANGLCPQVGVELLHAL